jgi:hypothetical protein
LKRSRWNELLGLPDELKYPDLYQILGLDPRTFDPRHVDDVFKEQMGKLQAVRSTKHKDFIEFAKGELRRARRVLENEADRAGYDAELARERANELGRLLRPVLAGGTVVPAAEEALVVLARELGMTEAEARTVIDAAIARSGATRQDQAAFGDTSGLTPAARAALAAAEAARLARLAAEAQERAVEAARLAGLDVAAKPDASGIPAPLVVLGSTAPTESTEAAIRRVVSERLGVQRRKPSDSKLEALPAPVAAPEPEPEPARPAAEPAPTKPRKKKKKKTAASRAAASDALEEQKKSTVEIEAISEGEPEPVTETALEAVDADEETASSSHSKIQRVPVKKPVVGLEFCDACGVSIPARWKTTLEAERVGARLLCSPCVQSAKQLKVCDVCEAILPKIAFERGDAVSRGGKHYCKDCR